MSKKIAAALLALCMAVSFAACSPKEPAGSDIDVTGDISGEITVSCYDSFTTKNFLDGAAAKFEEKYPGTKINVESFSKPPEIRTSEQDGMMMQAIQITDDPQSRADYISKVNTELMSGGGADIYSLDVLPGYRYAKNGQLENVKSYMDADAEFNMADYQQNVFDAAMYNGGLYEVPLDFSFEILAYDGTLVDDAAKSALSSGSSFTYSDLIALAESSFAEKKAADETVRIWGLTPSNMFSRLLKEDLTRYIDVENKKANFTDGSFEGLLRRLGTLEDAGAFAVERSMMRMEDISEDDMTNALRVNAQERHYFKTKALLTILQDMLPERTGGVYISTAASAQGITDDDVSAGLLANADGSIPFTSTQSCGINSNSSNKRLAWEFVKFLLSYDIQTGNQLSGRSVPVNTAAQEGMAKLLISQLTMQPGDSMGAQEPAGGARATEGEPQRGGLFGGESLSAADVTLNAEQQQILDDYMKIIREYSALINHYELSDTSIADMISEQISAYYGGTKSADEAARALQSKIELYLNE